MLKAVEIELTDGEKVVKPLLKPAGLFSPEFFKAIEYALEEAGTLIMDDVAHDEDVCIYALYCIRTDNIKFRL